MSVRQFVILICVLGGLAVAWDAYNRGPNLLSDRPRTYLIMAGCCMLTELRPLRWMLRKEEGGEVTASWTFLMALVLLGAPLAAVVAACATFILGDVVQRKAPVKVAFNAGQIAVSVTLASMVFRAVGQSDALIRGGSPPLVWFAAFLVAGALAFSANKLMTCTVIALHSGRSIRRVLRNNGPNNLSTDGMLLALSPVFIVAAERSLLLVPLLLVVTMVVYATARRALEREQEATHDALTDLPNRRLFEDRLADAVAGARRTGTPLSLAIVDLDGFKVINDRFGHEIGDLVLRQLAVQLADLCDPQELLARLGGDEFALITSRDGQAAARRLRAAFDRPISAMGVPVKVNASIGVVTAAADACDVERLLRRADEAMYQAKSSGTGVTCSSEPSRSSSAGGHRLSRMALLSDLTKAIDPPGLFLEYQPQVDLRTHAPLGFEALVRWSHPELGLVSSSTFMPLAEQTELIRPVTEWVLTEGLQQLARWRADGLDLRLSVNVSVYNLSDVRFPDVVARALNDTGTPAPSLDLEITENALATDHLTTRSVLHQLRELGVTISIDDFGTGYSSMAQLQEVLADQVKMDQRFVTRMAHSDTDASIVRAMVQLAQALGMKTMAEGIEDPLVASLLRDLGCDRGQGFLFGRPMPAGTVREWIGRIEPAVERRDLAAPVIEVDAPR